MRHPIDRRLPHLSVDPPDEPVPAPPPGPSSIGAAPDPEPAHRS
ncbi:hypothetical protein [Streptomyces sp.]